MCPNQISSTFLETLEAEISIDRSCHKSLSRAPPTCIGHPLASTKSGLLGEVLLWTPASLQLQARTSRSGRLRYIVKRPLCSLWYTCHCSHVMCRRPCHVCLHQSQGLDKIIISISLVIGQVIILHVEPVRGDEAGHVRVEGLGV